MRCDREYRIDTWPYVRRCTNEATRQFNIDGELVWSCEDHAPDESEGVEVP